MGNVKQASVVPCMGLVTIYIDKAFMRTRAFRATNLLLMSWLSAWGEESKALRVFASRCVPTPKVTVNSIEALALLAEI